MFDAEVVIEPESSPDPEPQLYCAKHVPNGTDDPCGACGGRRRAHERWERRHPPKSKIRAWAELTAELGAAEQRQSPGTAREPSSKLRTVAGWAAEARAAEDRAEEARASGQEPAPPPAIEARAAPAPRPRPVPPDWVPGPNGEPRCRRHGHLPSLPPHCAGCRAAEIAAGESPYRAMKTPARQLRPEGKR